MCLPHISTTVTLKVAKFAPCRKTRFKMYSTTLNSLQRVWCAALFTILIFHSFQQSFAINESATNQQISLLPSSSSSASSVISSPSTSGLVNNNSSKISLNQYSNNALSLVDSEPRTSDEVCQVCWCNRDEELDCRHRNDVRSTIRRIPQFPTEKERNRIIEITASNQPDFIHLDAAQLRDYSHLEKLTIENSALQTIDADAFQHNLLLTEISLKNNQIRTLSWKHFDGLFLLDLSIENNPFQCDCPTAKWIQNLVNQKRNILGPYWASITCVYPNSPVKHYLANLTINGCQFPTVQITPETIAVNESQPIVLTCTAESSPKPELFWNTSTLNSDYKIVNSESTQLIFINQNSEPVYRVSQILRIEEAQIDDNEQIHCWAENDVGRANDSVVIKVYSAPRIELMELEHKFYDCINFRVKGIPYANITWYKNNKPLPMKDGNYKEYRIKEHGAWINGYLEIQKESAGIMGVYMLVAENSFGRDNRSMYLSYKQGIIVTGGSKYPGNSSVSVEQPPIPPNSFVPPPILSNSEHNNPSADNGGNSDNHHRLTSQNRIDPNSTEQNVTFTTTSSVVTFFGVIFILLFVIVIVSVVYQRTHTDKKPGQDLKTPQNGAVNCSWDSNIDNNHNRRSNIAPIRAIATMFNWMNRKKRLLDARRTTRQNRTRTEQPKSRTALYYNNGRIRTGSCFSDRDPMSSPINGESDPTTIALLKAQRSPIGLVSNPNYMSDTTNLELENVRHISSEKISFIKELGEGAFGRVSLGTVDYLTEDEPTTLVAIKVLKEQNSIEIKNEFAREAELLANLVHKNIVTFFGISMDDTAMMIFEYMEYGDLNKFLRERDPFSTAYSPKKLESKPTFGSQESTLSGQSYIQADRERWKTLNFADLIHIATQIACGMEYLAKQRFVHRDLATRNCLVGMNLVTKIGDFGMSRDVYATDYYRVGRDVLLPIRWMSPESIMYRKYTTESDCWSFGILLWEILTYGKQPWFEYTNTEVIKYVTRGQHLVPPDECPNEIVELMRSCWQFNPTDRGTMLQIHAKFVELEGKIEDGTICLPEQIPLSQPPLPPPPPGASTKSKASTSQQLSVNCFQGSGTEASAAAAEFCRSNCSTDNDHSNNSSAAAVYLELSHA